MNNCEATVDVKHIKWPQATPKNCKRYTKMAAGKTLLADTGETSWQNKNLLWTSGFKKQKDQNEQVDVECF